MTKKKSIFILIFVFIVAAFSCFYYVENAKLTKKNEGLGTYSSPEEAFIETHKALNLISKNINSGMENAKYLEEYDKTKKKIFKE